MSDPIWEPWTPKVGDRVRVRLSGECDAPHVTEYRIILGRQDGWPGTVADANHPLVKVRSVSDSLRRRPDHAHLVAFDAALAGIYLPTGEVVNLRGGNFAAIELEPLAP